MNLAVVGRELWLPPPQSNIPFFKPTGFRPPWKRKSLVIRSCSTHQLLTSHPAVFLSQLAPALGFTTATATALALFYKSNSTRHEIGSWTLSTSPTPFNRFIKSRCASLLLEDSNDTGRIHHLHDHVLGKQQLLYQRRCIDTEDGGVVSLDWPAHLELTMEQGLDTTILIIPGTTDGSMDQNVKSIVCECLTRGCFPIVMNPRGCARSPLTTPRLFTGADSDDICTSVDFINRSRGWTTLMGVGVGYGANMLTKYLAEVGQETPLIAAACLDNPFDLKGASSNHLTTGLIHILQSNKELFLGPSKGFDVEKALQAKSLREFEEAISMVPYGFDSVEEFYVSSSTKDMVGKVKIPLLFIQNSVMPSSYIPHSLITENPYTSLLLFESDEKTTPPASHVSWCRHLVVEWLTAVELGLLKGRHPLLEDSAVIISPSKHIESNNSQQLDGQTSTYHREKMLKRSDQHVDLQLSKAEKKDTTNGEMPLVDLEGVDSERGKVVEATEVVMNMLDVSMPEALSEEQKLKVLTAVSQGETLMNALQDAVPEDVRGKLTSSVTAILEKQKKILNHVPDPILAKMQETSTSEEKETNVGDKKDDLGHSDDTVSDDGGETSNSATVSNLDQLGSDAISGEIEKSEDHVNDQVNLGLEEGVENDDKHNDKSESSTSPTTEEASTEMSNKDTPKEESSSTNAPSFGVSQAFDALTGMDDSTQLAVNSVFSVIEGVITQLEEKRDSGSAVDDDDNNSAAAAVPQKEDDGKSDEQVQETMHVPTEKKDEAPDDIRPPSITRHPYRKSLYDPYVQSHLYSKMKNDKKLLLQSHAAAAPTAAAAAAYLDYVPEEGQWKLVGHDAPSRKTSLPSDNGDIIEPAYVILDGESDSESMDKQFEVGSVASVKVFQVVKENIVKSLETEVSRRVEATDMLEKELEEVAHTISWAVVQHVKISWDGEKLVGCGNLQDGRVLDAISLAVGGTRYMREVIPVGIVVGSTLASLRKLISITIDSQEGYILQASDEISLDKVNQNNYSKAEESNGNISSDAVMVGAVTAALGASALLVQQQQSETSSNGKANPQEPGNVGEETSKGGDMVTSLAEKAMSVAGPVMPTTEGGGLDQERLVALLADLGQKGGILKLVGKVALLWGGIRGAMSLTGKLISFLRLADRPLFQRILGFVFMVLVLWTPVVVPLLPTLVQNWSAHNSSKYAELACIIGLYGSIMTLIVLWGKRVRGYEDPLERYGLEYTSARQIKDFVYGLIGGVMLVLLIQYTNVLLGFVCLSWPTIPPCTDAVGLLKLFGDVFRFVSQGLVTTVAIAVVEELLFRSWLPEEIAFDLGYNQGIILSGLAYSLSQWSLKAIPGVWLLSVGLAGVRQRSKGRLSIPIGLRAGIMASTFVLKGGGFLTNNNNNIYPSWVGGDGDPFNSLVGLAVAFFWVALLYPSQNALKENSKE